MRVQVSMKLARKVPVNQILRCDRKINVTIAKIYSLQATTARRFPLLLGTI
jgi:hypothetical protein